MNMTDAGSIALEEQSVPEIEMPVVPGLTIEQAQELVARHQKILIPKDDPVFTLLTLLNAYLTEIQVLQQRHEKGLGRVMVEKTDSYVQAVQKQLDDLVQNLSSASVEAIKQLFAEHGAVLHTFRANMTWLTIIVACSAVVNILVFVLLTLKGK